MEQPIPDNLTFTDVGHAPIVKQDASVKILNKEYRAILIHSSAHQKRCHKRIDQLLDQKRNALETLRKKIRVENHRRIAKQLRPVQLAYLKLIRTYL